MAQEGTPATVRALSLHGVVAVAQDFQHDRLAGRMAANEPREIGGIVHALTADFENGISGFELPRCRATSDHI